MNKPEPGHDDGQRPPISRSDVPPLAMRKRVVKFVAIAAVLPGVLLFVLVAFFVARTELAHNDPECAFGFLVDQEVPGTKLQIIEERRSCMTDVEEHRWMLTRDGEAPRELGRRRLDARFYAPGKYSWHAEQTSDGVVLTIEHEGVEGASFREHAPPRHRK